MSDLIICGETYVETSHSELAEMVTQGFTGEAHWMCEKTATEISLQHRGVYVARCCGLLIGERTPERAVMELVDKALNIAKYHGAVCRECPKPADEVGQERWAKVTS